MGKPMYGFGQPPPLRAGKLVQWDASAHFHFIKDLFITTGGEGGMVVTHDDSLWRKCGLQHTTKSGRSYFSQFNSFIIHNAGIKKTINRALLFLLNISFFISSNFGFVKLTLVRI